MTTTAAPVEAAALHARLLGTPDYVALTAYADARLEGVLSELERGGHAIERFESLAGELRGLRATRGASTVPTRGRKV